MKTRKLIFISLLCSVALIMGLLESYFPFPMPIPGAKLGLSNISVLLAIYFLSDKDAIIVAMFKSLLLMLVTGNVSAFLFSFTGAIVSSSAMVLCHKYFGKDFSVVSISVVGACFHNFAQVCLAAFILESVYIFSYMPILLIVSLFTGYIIGFPVQILVSRFNKNN